MEEKAASPDGQRGRSFAYYMSLHTTGITDRSYHVYVAFRQLSLKKFYLSIPASHDILHKLLRDFN